MRVVTVHRLVVYINLYVQFLVCCHYVQMYIVPANTVYIQCLFFGFDWGPKGPPFYAAQSGILYFDSKPEQERATLL